MDNKLEGINSRITKEEEQINTLKYRMVEITATKQNIENRIKKEMKKKKKERNEDSLRDLWDNTDIIQVPEGEAREKGPEKIFEERIVENCPNMGKEIVNQVRSTESQAG